MKDFLKLISNFFQTAVVEDDFELQRDRFYHQYVYLSNHLPKIVCLCGSTKFYNQFMRANYEETMLGNIILTVGFYPHAEAEVHHEERGCTAEQKIQLDELHKRKIDLCDEVYVLNVGGYIGSSTRSEIEYAQRVCKPIRYLEAIA